MHLTSVDLPAPLSPTRAVTWPASARKSTPLSTSTGPKLLLMPRISRMGTSAMVGTLLREGPRTVRGGSGGSGWFGGWGLVLGRGDRRRVMRTAATPGMVRRVRPVLLDAGLRAEGGVLAGAHALLGRVLVVDRLGHVGLGDRDRGGEDGRDLLLGLRVQ